MSENIENRIVRMEFDNERFEKNTKKTMSTLDKLKAKLDFSGVNKSIDETSESLDNLSTKKAEKSVGVLTKGYNALKVAAISAIATMSATFTQAIMQNKQLLSKMTQMRNGWNDYAIKTQSVQTILTALNDTYGTQAEKMDLVTEKIEQLKWFADETSYSLKGMTGALSKFLSAGVDLDQATNAVQGISVWAAMEGQGKQAAEHISTQMAQALGRNLMAQDWSSIETMNMGSETFKTKLLELAALDSESGVVEKDGKFYFGGLAESVSMYGLRLTETTKSLEEMNAENEITMANFRQYLSKGIISGGTLSKAFDEYGKFATALNDVNGEIEEFGGEAPILMKWRKFFDIYDNTGDAAEFFDQVYQNADLAEIFEATAYSAEDFYDVMNRLGGEEFAFSREGTFLAYEAKTFQEAIEATATGMATQFSDIFESIFGNYMQAREIFSSFAEWLYDIYITPLGELADDFKTALAVPEGELNPILQAFGNLGNVIMSVITIWRDAKKEVFNSRSETIKKLADAFASLTGRLSDFVTKNSTKIQSVFKGIFTVCKSLLNILKAIGGFAWDIITGIIDLLGGLFSAITDVFTDKESENGLDEKASLAERFANALEIVKDALSAVGKWFKNIVQYIKDSEVLNAIITALGEAFIWLVEQVKKLVDWGKDIGLWEKIATVLKWIGEGIAGIITGLAGLITGKGGGFGEMFDKASSKVKEFKDNLNSMRHEEEKVADVEKKDVVSSTMSMADAFEQTRLEIESGHLTMLSVTNDASMYAGLANGSSYTYNNPHPTTEAKKAEDAVSSVNETIEETSNNTATFGQVMIALGLAFTRLTDKFLNPDYILSLAIAIAAFAVSIGLLKKSLLSGNFFSLFSFGSISKSVEEVSAASVLVGLAAVIAVVAGAIWLLSTIPTDKLKEMTGVLIGIGTFIILILSELIYIENVIKGKTTTNLFAKAGNGKADMKYSKHGVDASDWLFATLLSIAGIIAACALIIWALQGVDYTNFGKFEGALLTIGAFVILILAEVVWLEKVMKDDAADIETNPATNFADIFTSSLVGVALIMFAIAKMISVLSKLNPDELWAMLPVLGIIFAFVFATTLALIIFCEKMASAEKKIDKKMTNAFKSGEVIGLLFAAVGAIGLLMTAVAGLILIIATNPHLLLAPDAFFKVMGTIALFITLLAAVMLGIVESFKRMPATGNNFDPAQMYKLVLTYCIGLSLIITAVAGLAATVGTFGLNPNFLENMAATMVLIALLMGVFAFAVTKLRKSKASTTNELVKMMLTFASALAIIITAFAIALAVMPNENLIAKAVILTSMIAVLGAGLWAITRFGKLDDKKVIVFSACLVALTTGMLAIAGAIKMLDGMSTNSIVAIGIALGGLLALMSGIVYLGQNLQGMAALWAAIFTVLLWIVSVALVNLAKAISISLPPIMDGLNYFVDMIQSGKFGVLTKGFFAFNIAMFLLAGTVPAMLLVALGLGAMSAALLPLGAAVWLTMWPLAKLMEVMSSLGDINFTDATTRFKNFLDGIAGMIESSIVTITRLGVMLGSSILIGLMEGTLVALNKISDSGMIEALAASLASTFVNLVDAFAPLLIDVFEWLYNKLMANTWGRLGLVLLTAGIPMVGNMVLRDALSGSDFNKEADIIQARLNANAKAAMEEYQANQDSAGGGILGGFFDGANGDTLTDILVDTLTQLGLTDFLKNENITGLDAVETDLVGITSLRGGTTNNETNETNSTVSYGGITFNITVEGDVSEERMEELENKFADIVDDVLGNKAETKAQNSGKQPGPGFNNYGGFGIPII